MAAGDRVIKILHRSNLPQGGYDLSGAPRQYVQVMANITGTYATDGIVLKPKDLGLKEIQHVSVGILKAEANTEQVHTAMFTAFWNGTTQKLNIIKSVTAGDQTQSAQTDFTLSVVAIGPGPAEITKTLP